MLFFLSSYPPRDMLLMAPMLIRLTGAHSVQPNEALRSDVRRVMSEQRYAADVVVI